MLTALFLFAALLQLYLAVVLFNQYRRGRSPYTLIPLLVVIALVLDNFIIAIGRFIGEGELLKSLNSIRFITHALFTSWMLMFVWDVARRVGLPWAENRIVRMLFWAASIGLTALGAYMDIFRLKLAPRAEADTLRYVNEGFHGPPIPAIVVILVMTVVGLLIWRKTKSPWVFLGALVEFICAPLGLRMPIVGQFGEVAFAGAMIAGENLSQKSK
jgi:uncharacterized membrane protein